MAVSGSSDFARTRDQLIGRALRIAGIIKAGETPGAQMVTDAAEALNGMVKRWQRKGLHVWAVAEATLFPQVSQVKYSLASGSSDHATETFYATEISAAEASGQTTLSVDSTTNMTVSDYIGVVVDDGTLHWSTVSSKTSTTVTIADALDDAAAAGNAVFTYTTKIVRPLKIPAYDGAVRRYSIASGNDTAIGPPVPRMEYNALPNKTQTGTINQVFYDPGRDTGYLYLWNPVAAVTDLVRFTWHRPIMDFDAAGDSPDFPQEWVDPLAWNLADALCEEYDVPTEKAMRISAKAAVYLDDVTGDDREQESLFMQADMG
jgi:hypothetical protein